MEEALDAHDQETTALSPTILDDLMEAFGERVEEIRSIDDLKQAFADRRLLRLLGFRYEIQLAALADAMGPAGRDAASECSGWSPQVITRLARLLEVQEQLLSPDLPLGVYWYILVTRDDLGPQGQAEALTRAINEGWSVADAKAHLGDSPERTGGTVVHCQAVEQLGRRLVTEGDEVREVTIPPGQPVSIRVLKR